MRVLTAATWSVAAGWAALRVTRGGWWRTDVRLPASDPPASWPSVAAVVPARDEEEVVGRCVSALAAQDYPGRLSVVVADDESTDATAARALAAAEGCPVPVEVVSVPARPPGWVGKLWAVRTGVSHAAAAGSPEWILLTDADIVHPPHSVRSLVSAAVALDRDAVSLMARLRTDNGWERLVVPAFVYFFGQLYPFRWVGDDRRRTAAAAGGCVLVRRDVLERAGGVDAVCDAVIDDVALAGALRRAGGRLWLGWADEVRSIRPYPRLGDLWDMVARSADTQLRHSPVLLAGTLAGLGALYLLPPAALLGGLLSGRRGLAAGGAAGWAVMTSTYLPTTRYHGLPDRWALTLPAAAGLYAAMTVDSARRHRAGTGARWKGRTYGQRPSPPTA